MHLQNQSEVLKGEGGYKNHQKFINREFSKGYVDYLDEAGWILERKLPSSNNQYSDLLEDTDWKSVNSILKCTRHYRRDLDAIS